MSEKLTVLLPSIILALATIVAAWITARSNKQGTNQDEDARVKDKKDKVVAISSVVAAGFAVTTTVTLMLYIMNSRAIVSSDSGRTLADFPESPPYVGSGPEALDRDAQAILDGAGPKEWVPGERTWKAGDVVYVDDSEWVEEVFPKLDRPDDSTSLGTCILKPKGKLTVRGFSSKQRSALIEYTAPGDGGGTACDTGVYFFYSLP